MKTVVHSKGGIAVDETAVARLEDSSESPSSGVDVSGAGDVVDQSESFSLTIASGCRDMVSSLRGGYSSRRRVAHGAPAPGSSFHRVRSILNSNRTLAT